jgi:hypothetical protein
MFCRFTFLGGRRRGGRRDGENDGTFVDVHGPALFAIVTGIVALNLLDAWFTLLFLSHGGRELNPLVDTILGWGNWPFVVFKTIGIGLCMVFLVLTKNFRAARIGIGVVLAGYGALLGWHLYLLHWLNA